MQNRILGPHEKNYRLRHDRLKILLILSEFMERSQADMCIRLFNAFRSHLRQSASAGRPRSTLHAPRSTFLHVCFCLLLALALAGCTTPRANPGRPEEHLFTVQASQLWQPSGISANQGNIIHCVSTDQWSDSFAKYGADGNPDTIKTHLGVSAPASGLLMRMGDDTNMVYFIGKETNVVAGCSGELKFRNNFSLSLGISGELKVRVTVATDTDGDGISDYEEIYIWKTNPLRVDSDGDGFSDLDEINDRHYRPTVAAGSER